MEDMVMRDPGQIARLREALQRAGYTVDGCLDLLGPRAYAALSRNEITLALRATQGGSPRETLVRLFLLQTPVPYQQAARALPVEEALAAGLLARDGDEVRALVDIRPYGETDVDWWVVSDLTTGMPGRPWTMGEDYVLGIGGASTTLAHLTVRVPVESALDLGTGCGVQALHLARHARTVTATDQNARAVEFARMSVALSGVEGVEFAQGDFFDPVRGRRYDLIVSNPPFVISPERRFLYRDSGLPGDEVCRRLVEQAPAYLNEGGWCQLLINWAHLRGQDWRERVASWVRPTGCDAWIVQREVQDATEYIELWLRDSGDLDGPHYIERYDAWLDLFERSGIEAVGFGWIVLHASGADDPYVQVEELPQSLEQPFGRHVLDWFARHDFLRDVDDETLLKARLRRPDGVVQETVGAPGAEQPDQVVLRQLAGARRAAEVDPATAALVGACDGTIPVGVLVDALAEATGEDPAVLRARMPTLIRNLVADGFLVPA
ncbi:transferase [Carbonactinospora thermoautotrophica]|uniref:Transferase n=3 Tax=Carbonactinospora thermoautotrophica TaxID=1469144 RepID=A0A132MI46_9ACTN|nr:class I SAM-dependent methyltransferase [Carbonactinospora thermoautotrophica]KWW97516.1 transferase [Carbonactinospora thermoautotrophica]